jgi:hypothetical protein
MREKIIAISVSSFLIISMTVCAYIFANLTHYDTLSSMVIWMVFPSIILLSLCSPLSKIWKFLAVLSAFIILYSAFTDTMHLSYSERITHVFLLIFVLIYLIIFAYQSGKKGWDWSWLLNRIPKRIQEWIKKGKTE